MSGLELALNRLTDRSEDFTGRLSVDGRLTSVRMKYERQEVMVVRGLLDDMPSYLRFDRIGVKLAPDAAGYAKTEVAEAFNIYRIFDPRTVSQYLINKEGKQVGNTTKWVASFSPLEMGKHFTIIDTLMECMQKQSWGDKSLWESEEVSFVVEDDRTEHRIIEMTIPDLPPVGPHLTIEFSY